MAERRAPPSGAGAGGGFGAESAATSRVSDATSAAESFAPPAGHVLMAGVLKKRGANLPVMRERYCVATRDSSGGVQLRSYKNQKCFARSPEKPAGAHALKCFGDWDGRGNFHRYDHAFLMETADSKVFFCAAPTADEKHRWVDVMKSGTAELGVAGSNSNSASTTSGDGEAAIARPSVAKRQSLRAPGALEPSGTLLFGDESDDDSDDDHDGQATDSEHSPDDGLFRSSSGADSVQLTDSDRGGVSKAEPADWGIFGDDEDSGPPVSKYDVVDRPVLLLDAELLNVSTASDRAGLASDAFLFEDVGPSRFGAVTVKKAAAAADSADDDLADFVDEGLAARLEREQSEKKLKRRAQKLESNRDLYAEMAAARLNSMRKDARHPPKKSPRELSVRPSAYGGGAGAGVSEAASEYDGSEDAHSHRTESAYDGRSSEADDLFARSEADSRRSGGADDGSSGARVRASEHRVEVSLGGIITAADNDDDDGLVVEQEGATVTATAKAKKYRERKAAAAGESQAAAVVYFAAEDKDDDDNDGRAGDRSDAEESAQQEEAERR
ncbi:hypothetical protein PybrP1_000874, partial [[Pythium] brassicae (nom. inval.)]